MDISHHSLVDHAKTGVKELPRNTAWALAKVLRPSRSIPQLATGAVDALSTAAKSRVRQPAGLGTVEAMLHQADRAAAAADGAEAEAMERAGEAKRAAEDAQRTVDDAEARMQEAEVEADEAGRAVVAGAEAEAAALVQRAERDAAARVERARAQVAEMRDQALADLRTRLDAEVDAARTRAQEAARLAEEALRGADEAAARARDLAVRASQAADKAAADAARTAERLRWDHGGNGVDSSAGVAALEGRTKAELLELAAAAHVDGRASMTKADLISALSDVHATN